MAERKTGKSFTAGVASVIDPKGAGSKAPEEGSTTKPAAKEEGSKKAKAPAKGKAKTKAPAKTKAKVEKRKPGEARPDQKKVSYYLDMKVYLALRDHVGKTPGTSPGQQANIAIAKHLGIKLK